MVGTTLAPLQVLVTDRDGAPVPGAAVTWSVAGGGGSLSSASTVANEYRSAMLCNPSLGMTAEVSSPASPVKATISAI